MTLAHAPPFAVELGFDLGVGVARVVDPARLVNHIEIRPLFDPQAVGVVAQILFAIEDAFDLGDHLTGLKVSSGYHAVSVNG